jgi:hypothetical protein
MMGELEILQNRLKSTKTVAERVAVLDEWQPVGQWEKLSLESQSVLKQLAILNQFTEIDWGEDFISKFVQIDHFYREIGGLIGYQVEVLKQLKKTPPQERLIFHPPSCDDISEETGAVQEAYLSGLKAMPLLSELYPLGGAADRLHLVDLATGEELPAAKLVFAGFTLFESLIRDLQAREWLYYRLFGKQLTTPICIMTSPEKQNERHVRGVSEEKGYFGRPKDRFRFIVQPLVPTVDEKGDWHSFDKPVLKPGGHGAIWKLARDEGVFDWLKSLGSKKALVRQINNPIAGLDYGLLAFFGIGCSRDMFFGFASCNRLVKSAEGMVVLVEKNTGEIALTNIEYCDFAKYGIEDKPVSEGELFSRFGSNTNILFVDLEAVEKAVENHPFPGLLINLKPTTLVDGKEVLIGRLESTMQNIADAFAEPKKELKTEKTFVVHNHRHKTISVAKKAYLPGKPLSETPELCFYELLFANRELLKLCGFHLPPNAAPEEYMKQGPTTLFLYHPALGPLYSIIRNKLRGGQIAARSELVLEVAEIDISHLAVDGSLQIRADEPLGLTRDGLLQYSDRVARCVLHNITVRNRGIDWAESAPYWKMDLTRKETVEIRLKGYSEFDARDVQFEGSHRFVVEDGTRMIVRQKEGKLLITKEPISNEPLWQYSCTNNQITLGRSRG